MSSSEFFFLRKCWVIIRILIAPYFDTLILEDTATQKPYTVRRDTVSHQQIGENLPTFLVFPGVFWKLGKRDISIQLQI